MTVSENVWVTWLWAKMYGLPGTDYVVRMDRQRDVVVLILVWEERETGDGIGVSGAAVVRV